MAGDFASPAPAPPVQREREPRSPEPQPWPSDPRALHAATGGDAATRIAVLSKLGRTAGNAATAQLVRSGSRHVQREPPTGTAAPTGTGADATAAVAEYILSNVRFTGVPRLQEIAKGGPPLSNKDKKTVVKPVQTALLDVGYTLLRYKDDGDFGSETRTAIEQFRADSKITDGEGFNASAMKALDKRAPAPGKLEQHYLDYGRLFADGKLDVTLALGYDEGGSHERELPMARAWFEQHKMTLKTDKPKVTWGTGGEEPDKAKEQQLSVPETWTGKQSVTYPDATGKRVTKDITLSITLIPPGTGAKASFAKALNDSEITLYSGHARRGIGPDFDKDKSPYENFVLGVNSALHKAGRVVGPNKVAQSHYVIGKKNDLETMKIENKWDAEKYRVWFFAACSTIAYIDELRGGLLPDKMDRHNLDIFGTTQAIPIAAGLAPVFSNLEGILAAETMEQIVERMQRSSFEAFRTKVEESDLSDKVKKDALKAFPGDWFMREGAADNQVAPGTP
jgi:peptidoglycan hydrolase-like protein with peptidoglycan-binding domain